MKNEKNLNNEEINIEKEASIEEAEVTAEKSDYEQLLAEKNELNEKYLRLAADFQNYKRRTENEKKEVFNYANESIITDFLEVIDNLERAINSAGKEDSLLDGIRMVHKQLMDILTKYGLKEIESENCQFDPNFHHAVMRAKSDESDSNTIIEVFQKGYTLNGKVIRPCMVKVAE
ncbi:MAG: nucleotide exchange factor GrpE [Clostridiales bacterium]|nr:nucleotide exchange factor GrpE [Clostridiales bacterium]